MGVDAILTALTIIEIAANTTVALVEFRAIVETARAEGRDISDAELKSLADRNQVKLDEVLTLLGA